MKALRYLLMVTMVLSVLSVSAQTPQYGNTYKPTHQMYRSSGYESVEQPSMEMRSTSIMPSSGSALPQAAVTGANVAGSTPMAYTPSGPRKVEINPGGGDDPDEPGDNSEPWEDPIGDAAWPMMLLTCVYILIRYVRTRKRA